MNNSILVVFTGNQIKDFIRQNHSTFEDMLETDDGLADYLFSKNVLNNEQYNRIRMGSNWRPYQEQNRELISVILDNDDSGCTSFIEALSKTNQRHVANLFEGWKMKINNSYASFVGVHEISLGIVITGYSPTYMLFF